MLRFFLRLPGVRHVRAMFFAKRLEEWRRAWGAFCVAESDAEFVRDVWRGEVVWPEDKKPAKKGATKR